MPEAMDLLIDWHRRVRGEHTSWDEYREKMRQEQRVVLRINIEKCLEAGYGQDVVVSNERKSLSKIKEMVSQKLSQADQGKVQLLQPLDFMSFIDEIGGEEAGTEETVRGYKVKTRFKPGTVAEKKAQKQAIAQIIFRGLRISKDKE